MQKIYSRSSTEEEISLPEQKTKSGSEQKGAAAALRLLVLFLTLGEKLQTALGVTDLQYTPHTSIPQKTDTVLCYRTETWIQECETELDVELEMEQEEEHAGLAEVPPDVQELASLMLCEDVSYEMADDLIMSSLFCTMK
ncbi:hypothetical protein KOW79_009335 [Hemibagrus wyckioides]|uniref:Uncharacterized protein n=1 Tax=Hemibagrus wyckioides TaxID=337641 RepID=A0A9D3NSH1_9TELE|nr:hypothetical protein KOW79_009335 [Hemibagrus wyckioides]